MHHWISVVCGPKFTKFFSPNVEVVVVERVFFPIFDMSIRSGDIRDQSLKWSKIDRNFACFWPPNFFGGAHPEFLEWDYKIQPDSDHVAKFQGDRPRELGDQALKKKHHGQNRRPPVLPCSTERAAS